MSIRDTETGTEFDVRVIPRAKKSGIAGVRGDAFVVRLAAPPVEGAANDALVRFLAGMFGVPQRCVRVVSGEHHRQKRVAITGVNSETARAILSRGRPL